MEREIKRRRAGRPKAIPEPLEAVVLGLYAQGYGYRAIARILKEDHGFSPDYTTVRRVLMRLGKVYRSEIMPK
jgi:hypothetical protein